LPPELFILAQICTKSFVGWGFAPDPTGRAYSAPPDPLAGLRGLLLREGEGREGKGREVEGKGGEGIKGKGRGRGPTPKGMVGDLLLREVRGLLLRAPHYRYWPPYSLNPGYGPAGRHHHNSYLISSLATPKRSKL